MRVITLDAKKIDCHSKEILSKIIEDGFMPDLILGVLSGGKYIAESIHTRFDNNGIDLRFCKPVRLSSENKKKKINNFLKHLPYPVLNILRILEAKILFNFKNRKNISEIEIPDDIHNYKKILIIDDAVDKGFTLNSIKKSIQEKAPKASIKTAAFTVTTKNPVILPDYYIYKNNTLIRFPWSKDAK